MIEYKIEKNGEVICTALVGDEDQLEIALVKLIGAENAILNVTAFIPSSEEPKSFASWETRRLMFNEDLTISSRKMEADVLPFVDGEWDPEPDEELEGDVVCSFCGKSSHEVEKVVASEHAIICDECIEMCWGIVNEEQT